MEEVKRPLVRMCGNGMILCERHWPPAPAEDRSRWFSAPCQGCEAPSPASFVRTLPIGKARRRFRPVAAVMALSALVLNAVVVLTLVDQLVPELNIKYQALKYARYVPWGARWVAWRIRNHGRAAE